MSDDCQIEGKMGNIYGPEDAIKALITPLFPTDNVFTQFTMDDLDTEFFQEMSVEDRVAALIIYDGFGVKGAATRNTQIISPLWRIVVVTPSELYNSVAGVKLMEVIDTVKGKKIYPESGKEMMLVQDVREFNTPNFVNSLVGIPAVFSFDTTI